jgi:hypothetical protein
MKLIAPAPLVIPTGLQSVATGAPLILQPNGEPLMCQFTVTPVIFNWGQNCTFIVQSATPCNLGIYGPNPTQIGPPFGRMRGPNSGDASNFQCEGNYTIGLYVLCFRVGLDGPPTSPITITIDESQWNIF